jgi:hypothetical protein
MDLKLGEFEILIYPKRESSSDIQITHESVKLIFQNTYIYCIFTVYTK